MEMIVTKDRENRPFMREEPPCPRVLNACAPLDHA